jgi:hypothetical protein
MLSLAENWASVQVEADADFVYGTRRGRWPLAHQTLGDLDVPEFRFRRAGTAAPHFCSSNEDLRAAATSRCAPLMTNMLAELTPQSDTVENLAPHCKRSFTAPLHMMAQVRKRDRYMPSDWFLLTLTGHAWNAPHPSGFSFRRTIPNGPPVRAEGWILRLLVF